MPEFVSAAAPTSCLHTFHPTTTPVLRDVLAGVANRADFSEGLVDMPDWKVPGYTELKRIGSGGFGDVVLARQDSSGSLVAVKYLRRELLDEPEFAGMF